MAGEREIVALSTAQLRDGTLVYMIAAAPETESRAYEQVFSRIRSSLELDD